MRASSGLTSRPDPNARSPRYGPISSPSTGILFRQEIALFKSELHEKLASLGTGAGPTAAGGLGAFSGWLALLAAAILAHHASPLDCQRRRYRNRAGLLWIGKSRLGADALVPRRTLNLLRADQAWSRIRLRAKGNHMDTENPKPGSNVSSVGDMLQANWIPLSLIGVGITGWWPATQVSPSVSRKTSACKLRAAGSARLLVTLGLVVVPSMRPGKLGRYSGLTVGHFIAAMPVETKGGLLRPPVRRAGPYFRFARRAPL
jgi:hypothetical protein